MKFVDPITDVKKIEEIKNILEESWNIRNLLMFVAWINFALRIWDLLEIKIWDVFEGWKIRDFFEVQEQKTGKTNRVYIPNNVKSVLKKFVLKYPGVSINPDNYLFFTCAGKKNISRRHAQNIIADITKKVGLQGRYSTHSLRKTWGYQARKSGMALELIQTKLNHSNMKITMRYLWITTEEIWEACLNLNL